MPALQQSPGWKKEAFQHFRVEIMKIRKPPPSLWCGLQAWVGWRDAGEGGRGCGSALQANGSLEVDPASNIPRFAGCWQFSLAFTLKASWLPSRSNSTGWVLQRSAEDQCLQSLVICKGQCIKRNNFKLLCRIAKLPSCNNLFTILALTGFLGWCFQILGTPGSALRQQ